MVSQHKLHVTFSAADVPGLDAPDGTATQTVDAEVIEDRTRAGSEALTLQRGRESAHASLT